MRPLKNLLFQRSFSEATASSLHTELSQALRQRPFLIPCFTAVCHPDPVIEFRFGWQGRSHIQRAVNLLPGNPVLIPFLCPEDGLHALELLCGNHMRQNTSEVRFELFKLSGDEFHSVVREDMNASRFSDNTFHTFSFPMIRDSKESWFVARLSTPDSTLTNGIAIYSSEVPQNSDPFRILERGPLEVLPSCVNSKRLLLRECGLTTLERAPSPPRLRLPMLNGSEVALVIPAALGESEIVATLTKELEARGATTRTTTPEELQNEVANLFKTDLLVFAHLRFTPSLVPILRAASMAGIPTVAVETQHSVASAQLALHCTGRLPSEAIRAGRGGKTLEQILVHAFEAFLPKVSIVSVLYQKEEEVGYFLEALFRQTYHGPIEIIFVDDSSPDNSVHVVNRIVSERSSQGVVLPEVRVLRNERNLGNCISRNLGIAAATGEIVVVIDADCLVNADFISLHVDEYRDPRVDVVIGFFNLETGGEPPLDALRTYERHPERVEANAVLQDPVNRSSFLNCITRNFSIRRRHLTEPLFDEAFTYSRNPNSGYGWEDVEMGYRLYERGLHIRFAPRSFSVHITHRSVIEESTKPLRSLKNFRRLLEKHPALIDTARRWVLETYDAIIRWCGEYSLPVNDDRRAVDTLLSPRANFLLPKRRRKLRILTYRWHCAHQFELYKSRHEFTLVRFPEEMFTNEWDYDQRPLPQNAKFRPVHGIDERNYDLALLHFDENVLAPYNCNGVIDPQWGFCFRFFREEIKLPKIAICHGTPQFRGQYNPEYPLPDLGAVIEEERKRLVAYVGDIPVVVNSHQAQAEWRFQNSHVIWHGFDPTEFAETRYRKGILSLGRSMVSRPFYRGYHLFRQVAERVPAQIHGLSVEEPHPRYGRNSNSYAEVRFELYRNALRDYSIYFNPTLRSPMPRSRGEAMMCGLVTVSAKNHDVERFITNEHNGFFSNDPEELAQYLRYLLDNREEARTIGRRGRALACDLFNIDRYLGEWDKLLRDFS